MFRLIVRLLVSILDRISGKVERLQQGQEKAFAEVNRKLDAILLQVKPEITLEGGKFMYGVKDDNPDVSYNIEPGTATDAEGNVIPDVALTIEITSTDDSVVQVIQSDDRNGTLHFGNPGQASIEVSVKDAKGTLLGAFGAQFTVTVGDPAAISGGKLNIPDLTELPEA